MNPEIEAALAVILDHMTWREAADRLSVSERALSYWLGGAEPTWTHGKAIVALAETLRGSNGAAE